jgi:pheophorbide a oxygenase
VIPVQDLNPDTPNKSTLLGMDLIVWLFRPSGTWRALFAILVLIEWFRSPKGESESTGVLQCAYHGWEFDKEGVCVRIPQFANCTNLPAVSSARAACASTSSFPCQVQQGLIWIFPASDESLAASKELPLIPELEDPECVDATNFFVSRHALLVASKF